MDYYEIAEKIIEYVGTNDNIVNVMSCMTRLRIEVKDKTKINKEAIEVLDKVKGTSSTGNIIQIILFKDLDPVYKEVLKLVDVNQVSQEKVKKSIKDRIFDYLQGVFVPLIPLLVIYGFFSAFISIIDATHIIANDSSTYTILTAIKEAPMYFFPIFIAYSAAKYLKCNPYISSLVACILVHPSMIGLAELEQDFVSLFVLPVKTVNYTSTVLPVLISVFCVYYAEKIADKVVPDTIKFIRAFVALVIALPFCLCITAPLGSYITMGFSVIVNWMTNEVPLLAGIVIGGLANLLVIVGMQTAVIPLIVLDMVENGQSCLVSLLYFGGVILSGIAFGAFFKIKNKEDKSFLLTSTIVGIFTGVIEPCLFGVVLRFKKCIPIMIGIGMVNGAVVMLLKIAASAMGNGVFGFAGFIINFPVFIVTYVVTFVISAVLTYFFGGIEEVKA